MPSRRHVVLSALVATAAIPAIAHATVSFTPLGTLGGTYSSAGALSASGTAATGQSTLLGGASRAYRWTPGGGMVDLGTNPGMTYSNGTAMSADGSTAIGVSGNGSVTQTFRWNTGGGGMVSIGVLPGADQMYPGGVSANGNVIVGNADQNFGFQKAYRWQNGGGFTDLGYMPGGTYARATSISADASTIAGYGDTTGSGGGPRAFTWTTGGGFVNLGTLPGGSDSYTLGMSDDGVPVGYARNSLFQFRPVVYSGGTVNDLGMLAGFTNGSAYDASLGASSVVGNLSGGGGTAAFLWTSGGGMLNLNTYFPTLGIDLTGWNLQSATSISADGLTLMGYGTHNGLTEAWVATIPAPAVGARGLGVGLLAMRRRR